MKDRGRRIESTSPEWSGRIRSLLDGLKLTQAALAERLGVSPATVSRWIQGKHEPTAETYIAMGNLAPRPDGVYFWERAGMDTAGLTDASLAQAVSSLRVSLEDFTVLAAGKVSQLVSGKGNVVAIPLLNATAYGDQVPPKENVNLSEVDVEGILLAPVSWCPHPEQMISMHLQGVSMDPVIPDGSIIFVDTAITDRASLSRRIAVVTHRDLGFKVARFQRLAGSDVMLSANSKYAPIDVSNASKWKMFGEVLWWVVRDAQTTDAS